MKIWQRTESETLPDREFNLDRKTVLILPGIDADDSMESYQKGYTRLVENFLGGKDAHDSVDIYSVSWSPDDNERVFDIDKSNENPKQHYNNDIEELVLRTIEPIIEDKSMDSLDNLTVLTHSYGGAAIRMVEARLNMVMLKNDYSEEEMDDVFDKIKVLAISPPTKTKERDQDGHFPTVFILPNNDLLIKMFEHSDYYKEGGFHPVSIEKDGKNMKVEGTVPSLKVNQDEKMIYDFEVHGMKHISTEHSGNIKADRTDLMPQLIQNSLNNLVKREDSNVSLEEALYMTPTIAGGDESKSFSNRMKQEEIKELLSDNMTQKR